MDKGLKIRAGCIDTGAGQLRYQFTINPLISDSPIFTTALYCFKEDRDKNNPANKRDALAFVLHARHRNCWQRYHAWRENR